VAYSGWIAYAALFIFRPRTAVSEKSHGPLVVNVVSISVMLAFWTVFAVQKSPWTFYVYIVFPCYFWNQVILCASQPILNWFSRTGTERRPHGNILMPASLVIVILQSMVVRIYWSQRLLLLDSCSGCLHLPMVMEPGLCTIGYFMASFVVATPYPIPKSKTPSFVGCDMYSHCEISPS